MAFIAFHEFGAAAVTRRNETAPAPANDDVIPTGRLTTLEWTVVALARRDRLASLRQPGAFGRAMRNLLRQPNPMLADPRLEALRRIAVLTWHHGYTIPSAELRRFIAAGFSTDQYETVADSIGAARVSRAHHGSVPA